MAFLRNRRRDVDNCGGASEGTVNEPRRHKKSACLCYQVPSRFSSALLAVSLLRWLFAPPFEYLSSPSVKFCKPLLSHYEKHYTCNDLHDVDMLKYFDTDLHINGNKLGLIAQGWWRAVFSIVHGDSGQPLILKGLRFMHVDKQSETTLQLRWDALVMDRLRSSPNVVDIYAFCGTSMITEHIPMTLRKAIQDQIASNSVWSPERRAKAFTDMAKGLEALQSIKGGPVIHGDLHTEQFLVTSDGTVKLNDFNRAEFPNFNERTMKPCKFTMESHKSWERAPEEYLAALIDEKIDVFALANIFYELLTLQRPWAHIKSTWSRQLTSSGVTPTIPRKFTNRGSIDLALAQATKAAWTLDPKKRPSASQLVEMLEKSLTLKS